MKLLLNFKLKLKKKHNTFFQLLNLTFILRLEWNSCVKFIEMNSNPLAVVDFNESNEETDYVAHSQIDAIELTYIRCHQYLANKLNNEVYIKNNSFRKYLLMINFKYAFTLFTFLSLQFWVSALLSTPVCHTKLSSALFESSILVACYY